MRTNLIKNKEEEEVGEGMLDMVIAFDTTGSMSRYIEGVKQKIKDLVNNLFNTNPNLRIGVVAFGDYCDMLTLTDFGKAYQELLLTNDKQAIINFITKAQDTGGGDTPEFYELVLDKINKEFNWRKNAKKSILLVADSDYHKIGYKVRVKSGELITCNIDMNNVIEQSVQLGIKIDTLDIYNSSCWLKTVSEKTNGVHTKYSGSDNYTTVIEAAALSRGDTKITRDAFYSKQMSAMESGDTELTALYTAYSKEITK
jgi:hypothetical protein